MKMQNKVITIISSLLIGTNAYAGEFFVGASVNGNNNSYQFNQKLDVDTRKKLTTFIGGAALLGGLTYYYNYGFNKPNLYTAEPNLNDDGQNSDNKDQDSNKEQPIQQNYTVNNTLKSSASSNSLSLSLSGGYRTSIDNFGFITEVSFDFISNKAGKNSNNEVELTSKFNSNLVQKIGYSFSQNTLTYVNLGLGIKNVEVKYNDVKESKNITTLVIGAGNEVKVMDSKLGLFTELNNIISLSSVNTKIGKTTPKSYEIKVGARYYF